MGSSDNRIRAYDLAARCCHGAFYAAGFLTTTLIFMAVMWIVWCYFGLSILQVSNSQRRAVVNYSITTAKPQTSTTSPPHNHSSGEPSFETSLNTISKSVTTSSSFHRGSSRGESQLKSDTERKDISRGNTSLSKGDFAARDRAAPGAKDISIVSIVPPLQNSESDDGKTKETVLTGELKNDGIHTSRVASSNHNRPNSDEPIENKDVLEKDNPAIIPMKVQEPTGHGSIDEERTTSREYPKPEGSSTVIRDEIQSTRRSDADTVSHDPNLDPDPPRTYVRERTRYDEEEDRGSRSRYDTRDRGRDRVRHIDDRYSKGDTRLYPEDGRGRTIDERNPDEKISSYDGDRYDDVPRRRGDDDRIRDSDERYIYRDDTPRYAHGDPRYKSRDTRYEERDEERYRTRDEDRYRLRDNRRYRLRDDKNDRSREDDKYRTRYEDRDESRIDGRDRSRIEDRYRSRVDDRDRPIIDDRDRSSIDPRDRTIIDDRDRSRIDERDRSRIDDKDRSIVEDRHRSRIDDRDRSIIDDRVDGSSIIEPDRSRVEDKIKDDDKDKSRVDDRYRTRVESVDRTRVDDRYETGYEDREKSLDEDRHRTRGDDRDKLRDEDDYKSRVESRRRISEDRLSDDSPQGTRYLERGRYSPRREEDRYKDDTRNINKDYKDTVSDRTDTLPSLERSPLPVRKNSNVRGDREETEYDYPTRGSVHSNSDGVSRTILSETRHRDRDDDYRTPSRYDDRDRISPSRVGDDTHSTRSTSLDSRSRSEMPLPKLSDSRHRDRYPEDRIRDTKYYDDEDRKRMPSSLEGSSRRSQDDDRREYKTRLPGEKVETRNVDRGEEVVLDRRSYASEEDDGYREKSNSRTGSYDGRTDTRPRGDDEYEHRSRTDDEDEYPRRRKDDTEVVDEYPRRRKDDLDEDDEHSRRRKDKDEEFRHARPRGDYDTSRTQHGDSYDEHSRYDADRTVRRYNDTSRNRDEVGLRKDERPHRNTDDRPSSALDHVYPPPKVDETHSDVSRSKTTVRRDPDTMSSSNVRVPIGDRDMKHQDNRERFPSNVARVPHRIISPDSADSERIAPDSGRREYPGRSRSEERPLNAKDVIEAALRHSDLTDSMRKVSYPVFDPRVSNLTSADVIRPNERRGSTIQSRRKRWLGV